MNDASQMIKDLVDRFGSSAESIIANGLNMVKQGNNYRCPSPHNHRHGDKNASMGWVKDKYYFNCLTCHENIDIYTYYKNYLNYTFADIMNDNGIATIEEKHKKFKAGVESGKSKLTQEQIDFILARGITLETIKYFKLINWNGDVGIPYFKNGHLTAVKRRILNPSENRPKLLNVPDGKLFFFNYDNIELSEPVFIVEGEFDCMVMHQLGYTNTVSVGCGATALTELFEQAEYFFNKVPEFIIVSDNDKAGNEMQSKFVDRLGDKIAVIDKDLYLGKSDVNDVYKEFGEAQVHAIIKSGKRQFDGEWDIDNDPYTGIESTGTKFIPTGIYGVDEAINDIQTRTVTLVTGRSNSGKSTFVNQIVASAVSNGFKCYMAIGEGNKDKIINRWYTSMIGYDSRYYTKVKFNKKYLKEPRVEVLNALRKWHKDKLKLYIKSMSKYKNTEQLFDLLNYKMKTEKFDLLVIDNLMSLLSVDKSSEKLELQAKFIEKCHTLADGYNVAVIVVLHPNKTYQKGKEMDFEQIAGTSDIGNKADVILSVIRTPDSDDALIGLGITSRLQVLKNRDYSELPMVNCSFDLSTNTYGEIGKPISVIGSWRKYLSEEDIKNLEWNGVQPDDDIESIFNS